MSYSQGVPPQLGTTYSVNCPSCHSDVTFECTNKAQYGAPCGMCDEVVDLRDPTNTLAKGDAGHYPSDSGKTALYSTTVESNIGLSAAAQAQQVMKTIEAQQSASMPKVMTSETVQAFSSRRNQQLAEKLWIFFPFTYMVEWLVFGTRPTAKVGHVRIFTKSLPFLGKQNIPVPRTSTSYAAPTIITLSLIIGYSFVCQSMALPWMLWHWNVEVFIVIFYFVHMYILVYSDPGYVKPAYITNASGNGRATQDDELTLKDIATDERESQWVMVNNVPMERKWCSTCEFYRPLRAAHCYNCGLCVYNHDHHCSVIGACVGVRSAEMFTVFVLSSAIAVAYPFVILVMALYHHSAIMTNGQLYTSIVLLLPLLVFTCTLGTTGGSMLTAMLTEKTTRERIQGVYSEKPNPFDRGILKNIWFHYVTRKQQPAIFDDAFVQQCAERTEKRDLGTGVDVVCV